MAWERRDVLLQQERIEPPIRGPATPRHRAKLFPPQTMHRAGVDVCETPRAATLLHPQCTREEGDDGRRQVARRAAQVQITSSSVALLSAMAEQEEEKLMSVTELMVRIERWSGSSCCARRSRSWRR